MIGKGLLSAIYDLVTGIKTSTDDISGLETKIDTIDTVVDGIKTKTDTIPTNPLGTANIAVPIADSADNVDAVDVIGNKTDSIMGTSAISLIKQNAAGISNINTIPIADAATNSIIRDVIGNKSDTVLGTSLIALIKKALADTIKIDGAATLGLLGTHNSAAYRTAEIERHFHGREKWFGLASSPSAETRRADRMNGTKAPFRLTAGNNTFGAWVQVLGSSDTPVKSGMAYFDFHRILVSNTDSTAVFIVQAIAGESADFAAKLAAEEFTEFAFKSASNSDDSGITEFMTSRVAAGTKIWMRCANIGNNGKVIDLYFGLHEYEG
jgi:hypothetical protein